MAFKSKGRGIEQAMPEIVANGGFTNRELECMPYIVKFRTKDKPPIIKGGPPVQSRVLTSRFTIPTAAVHLLSVAEERGYTIVHHNVPEEMMSA